MSGLWVPVETYGLSQILRCAEEIFVRKDHGNLLSAGYFGGWLDQIIMRYIDLQWAFPNILIAVYLVAVFGSGLLWLLDALFLAPGRRRTALALQAKYPDIPEYMGDKPPYMGLGIKRETPNHY